MSEKDYKEICIVKKYSEVEKYKPYKTRPTISIYEYARVLTELALYLYNLKDLNKYLEPLEVKNVIDPCALANKLTMNGTFDAIIDRGYERVSFSELNLNNIHVDMVKQYLQQQEETRDNEILKGLGLI